MRGTDVRIPGLRRVGLLGGNHGSKRLRGMVSLICKVYAMEVVDREMAHSSTYLINGARAER